MRIVAPLLQHDQLSRLGEPTGAEPAKVNSGRDVLSLVVLSVPYDRVRALRCPLADECLHEPPGDVVDRQGRVRAGTQIERNCHARIERVGIAGPERIRERCRWRECGSCERRHATKVERKGFVELVVEVPLGRGG